MQASLGNVEASILAEPPNRVAWVFDTAATAHFCNNRKLFSYFTPVKKTTMQVAAKGVKIPIKGRGQIILKFGSFKIKLDNVLFSPRLRHNLISGSKIDEKGGTFSAGNSTLTVCIDGGKFRCNKENGLFVCRPDYLINVDSMVEPSAQNVQTPIDKHTLWHRRFGHISLDTIIESRNREAVAGMPKLALKKLDCKTCRLAKSRSISFPHTGKIRSGKPLELIHTDVAGPFPVPTLQGHKYFVTFIDDYSRFTTIFLMRQKSEVFELFKLYQARLERLTGLKILNVRTDNGAEYVHDEFKRHFNELGIKAERTNVYTPAQNGVAERINLTALNAVRSMLLESHLGKELWGEALMAFEHTWNRVCRKGNSKTPYETVLNRKPFVGNLKIFGSKCFVNIPKKLIDKLQPRAQEGILVGYARRTKGYRIYLADQGKVIETANVRVTETANGEVTEEDSDQLNLLPVPPERRPLTQQSRDRGKIPEPTPSTSQADEPNWVREVVTRSDKSRCDVYYRLNGQGHRYRSHHDIRKFYDRIGKPYPRDQFDFRSRYGLHHPDQQSAQADGASDEDDAETDKVDGAACAEL